MPDPARRGGDRLRDEDDATRAQAAGFDGYIAKPISVRTLPEQLAPFLSGRA